MRNKILISLVATGLLFASCADNLKNDITSENEVISFVSNKIVNTPENSREGTLLVALNKDATKSSDASRESLYAKSVEELTSLKGVLSVKPAFQSTPGKEALEEECGLDKWFVVRFDETTGISGLTKMANVVATQSGVHVVEFNKIIKRASDGKVRPFREDANLLGPVARTRVAGNGEKLFNDPMLESQWHYINKGDKAISAKAVAGADINVKDAWSLTTGDPSIIVAVIDEGVKYNHPDLAPNMWVNEKELNGTPGKDDDGNGYKDDIYGYDFSGNCSIKYSTGSHGTHVAGTVAAVNNNQTGVCGIAGGDGSRNSGVRIMSCQIFDDLDPYDSDYRASANAFKYAADNGASIAQCSWGIGADEPGAPHSDNAYLSMSRFEKDAIDYFIKTKNNDVVDGGIVIFAGGNELYKCCDYPGAYHDYIAVTSIAADFLPAYYTNYGPGANIAAPGGEYGSLPFTEKSQVLSTVVSEAVADPDTGELTNADYGYMQGTSMACPHVSGVTALGLSYAKKLGKKFTLDQFKAMILTSVNAINGRLHGEKSIANGKIKINLSDYKGNMGTGAIDAWKLLMQIEGTPCLQAEIGTSQTVNLIPYFGGDAKSLKYLSVEVSDKGMKSLGLKEKPEIKYGKLMIHPTKIGSAKIKIKAIAGGKEVGGGHKAGGMEITKEVSIISRNVRSINGGWL